MSAGGKRVGAGRPKGSTNRTSDEIREALLQFIDTNLKDLQNTYNGLDDKEKVRLFLGILRFTVAPAVNPEQLSIDQLQQIIQFLRYENEKRIQESDQESFKRSTA